MKTSISDKKDAIIIESLESTYQWLLQLERGTKFVTQSRDISNLNIKQVADLISREKIQDEHFFGTDIEGCIGGGYHAEPVVYWYTVEELNDKEQRVRNESVFERRAYLSIYRAMKAAGFPRLPVNTIGVSKWERAGDSSILLELYENGEILRLVKYYSFYF